MSLKSFHIVFIGAAFLLAVFLGVWWLKEYFVRTHHATDLVLGIIALAGSVGLVVYGRYFVKKLKNINYF